MIKQVQIAAKMLGLEIRAELQLSHPTNFFSVGKKWEKVSLFLSTLIS